MDNHMMVTQDPLANYVCGKVKDEDMNDLVSGDMCDYGMVNKNIIDKLKRNFIRSPILFKISEE